MGEGRARAAVSARREFNCKTCGVEVLRKFSGAPNTPTLRAADRSDDKRAERDERTTLLFCSLGEVGDR